MHLYRTSFVFTAMLSVFVFPAMTTAQEVEVSQYEHVKGLEPFIGFWATGDPDGEGGTLAINCRWTANKSYGRFDVWTRDRDERTHLGSINIGWDGAEKKLAMWALFPDMQAKANPSIDGNTITWTSQGIASDGAKTSGDVKFEVDGDVLTINVTNGRRGDTAQPDMNLTLTRREMQRRDR